MKIDGVEIGDKGVDLRTIRRKIGLVFQYPEHQLFEETVWLDVAFGPRNMGIDGKELEGRVQRALAAVDIDEVLAERSPFELSGGEKRRVAIAGVLAMEPSVLILDEPTAGFEPRGREDILAQVQRLQEQRDLTVVFVSHNMAEVARLADRLVVMDQGRIAMQGPPRDIFQEGSRLEAMGLGVPDMTLLMQKLISLGWDLPASALTVEDAEQAIMAVLREKAGVDTGAKL